MLLRSLSLAVVSVTVAASAPLCGDDDGGHGSAPVSTVSETVSVTASGSDTGSEPGPATSLGDDEPVPTLALDDACSLVPDAEAATATGLTLDEGVPDGDERRRVCTFRDEDAGVGITLGVQPGDRFDEKAEASRRALGEEGDEIDDLGDRALFFYSAEDLPEGVGGMLVGIGDLTVEVTMQGLDEATMLQASTNLAEVAVGNLCRSRT